MSLLLFFAGTGYGPAKNRHDSDGVWRKIRKRQFDEQQAAFDDALKRKARLHQQLMRAFHPLVDEDQEYEPLPLPLPKLPPNIADLSKTILLAQARERMHRMQIQQDDDEDDLAMILKEIP